MGFVCLTCSLIFLFNRDLYRGPQNVPPFFSPHPTHDVELSTELAGQSAQRRMNTGLGVFLGQLLDYAYGKN